LVIRIIMFRPEEKFKDIEIDQVSIKNVPLTKIVYNKIETNILKNYKFDYVIFTSSIAVESFMKQCPDYGNFLNGKQIIAIGTKTSESLGLKVRVPANQSSEGIINILKNNSNVLLVRSENGNPYLVNKLKQKSRNLFVINAYKSILLNEDFTETYQALKNGDFDAVIFTSSMIFNSYISIFSLYGKPLEILPEIVLAIGSETARSMKKYNLNPVVMDRPDVEESIKKILSLFKKYRLD